MDQLHSTADPTLPDRRVLQHNLPNSGRAPFALAMSTFAGEAAYSTTANCIGSFRCSAQLSSSPEMSCAWRGNAPSLIPVNFASFRQG